MASNDNNWRLGEIATLPRAAKVIKKSGVTAYARFISSRYVCIREATEKQHGILVKVLGKIKPEYVMVVGNEPFVKDEHDELFECDSYLSFPFPTTKEVREVLDIVRSNPDLIQVFKEASMRINPQSKFWVNETVRRHLIMKKPQCYDANSDTVFTPSDDDVPYRLTLVYFYKGQLVW